MNIIQANQSDSNSKGERTKEDAKIMDYQGAKDGRNN